MFYEFYGIYSYSDINIISKFNYFIGEFLCEEIKGRNIVIYFIQILQCGNRSFFYISIFEVA